MKFRIIIACVTAVLIFLIVYYAMSETSTTSETMKDFAASLQDAADNGEFEQAHAISFQMSQYWGKYKKIMTFFCMHKDLQEIDICIGQLKVYTKENEKKDIYATLSSLFILLDKLSESSKIILEMIF